jgi:hypothetical protein
MLKRKAGETMSEAFEKWISGLKEKDTPRNVKGVAKLAWDASRASTLAEVERMVEERMKNSEDSDAAFWRRTEDFDILSAIRAMKKGG